MSVKDVVQDEGRANALSKLQDMFEREYDLSNQAQRQTFVEGMLEFAKHAAATGSSASISVTYGGSGLTGINVRAYPTPV